MVEEMGPAEMKYRYDCKVEVCMEELAVLGDVMREEFKRIEKQV